MGEEKWQFSRSFTFWIKVINSLLLYFPFLDSILHDSWLGDEVHILLWFQFICLLIVVCIFVIIKILVSGWAIFKRYVFMRSLFSTSWLGSDHRHIFVIAINQEKNICEYIFLGLGAKQQKAIYIITNKVLVFKNQFE